MAKVLEYDGWKVGDMAHGRQYGTDKPVYGEIKAFHPEDKLGPAVTIVNILDGSYISILVSTLSDEEPKKVRKIKSKKTT